MNAPSKKITPERKAMYYGGMALIAHWYPPFREYLLPGTANRRSEQKPSAGNQRVLKPGAYRHGNGGETLVRSVFMKRLSRIRLALTSVLALLSSAGQAASYDPHVGRRHPDFTLPDIRDGKAVSLSQFHGKKVLLIQFASW